VACTSSPARHPVGYSTTKPSTGRGAGVVELGALARVVGVVAGPVVLGSGTVEEVGTDPAVVGGGDVERPEVAASSSPPQPRSATNPTTAVANTTLLLRFDAKVNPDCPGTPGNGAFLPPRCGPRVGCTLRNGRAG
jgi:hypothetical protein